MTLRRNLAAASLTTSLVITLSLISRNGGVHAQIASALGSPVQATLVVNGKSIPVSTSAPTISALLAQENVAVVPGSEVHPDLAARLTTGTTVTVETPRTILSVVRKPVPFNTIYKKTERIFPGRRVEARHGAPGLREEHYGVTWLGGRPVGRTFLKAGWLRRPQDRVILVGTDPFLSSLTSRGMGQPRQILNMLATEYDIYLGGAGSSRTCTGVRARRGIVAVDPRVIPLGTHLYVPGYGYCVAADTGGAIKGHRIDLCVEGTREANRYGAHRLRVYVVR